MKITARWIAEPAPQTICATLMQAGYRALFVGGCVRNSLLGHPISDIDIATDASPDAGMALFQAAGMRVVPTGFDHGTLTVIADGQPFEVTTFRRDVETDGRRAVVAYSISIEDDAARRDFTMNALYADAQGVVIDPLGGLPDLLARRVRFVGRPANRIAEDYLRILRFFRFHAWYGDEGLGIDADGLAACAAGADGIDGLSRERVGAEMRKLLTAPDPAPAVAAMAQSGVLARVLPGADAQALAPLVHLEDGVAPDWRRRLAVLGTQRDTADRLRLSRADAGFLAALRRAMGSGDPPGVVAYRHGADLARAAVLVTAASIGSGLPDGWADAIRAASQARFPVRADDLLAQLQGPALGARLAALESEWIASGFTLTKDQLLR